MKNSVKKEIEEIIKEFNLDCSVDEFKDNPPLEGISAYYNVSEDFIREFQDKINWYVVCRYKKLSLDFILEFKDKVNWEALGKYQNITKKDIEKLEKQEKQKIEKELEKNKS